MKKYGPIAAGAICGPYASRGVPPHIMGIGPIEAIPAVLKSAGLTKDQIDWYAS